MNLNWIAIRSSGLVAFGLLAASTIWGLLLSTGLFNRVVKAKGLTYMHESLAIGSLLATGVHIWTLLIDEFIAFDLADVFVPGRADWRPLAVAYGVIAFYGLLIVVTTFYIRQWIGRKTWRVIHYSSFGIFCAGLLHGVTAGTDTRNPFVLMLYVVTAYLVVSLVVTRARHTGETPARAPTRVAREKPAAGGSSAEE